VPLGVRGLPAGVHVVDCGQRRPGEEGAGGLGVVQVPVLLQVRVDGLLDGPYFGLPGDVAQRGEQVAPYLDGAHDAVAVHEQGGAAQPGGGVDPGLGRGVSGEDLRDGLLPARLDGEGERVADDAVTDPRRRLEPALRGIDARRRAARLADDVEAKGPGVPDATVQRFHHLHVLLAVDPGQERRGALPLTGDEPLGGVLDRLAQLVADVSGDGGDLVAQLLVRLQELLLGTVVDVHQQDDTEPGAVEHGLGDTLRHLSGERSGNTFGRGGHPAHISLRHGVDIGSGERYRCSSILWPSPGERDSRELGG
jgi:hypothetical protein